MIPFIAEEALPYWPIVQGLLAAGYREHLPSPAAAAIDARIAEAACCPHCHRLMVYRPWLAESFARRSYRAFSVCLMCDLAAEF